MHDHATPSRAPAPIRVELYLDDALRCCASTTAAPPVIVRDTTHRRAASKLRRLLTARYGAPVELELEFRLPEPLRDRLAELHLKRSEWSTLGAWLKEEALWLATALFEHRITTAGVAEILKMTSAQLTALIATDRSSPHWPRRPSGRRRVLATMRSPVHEHRTAKAVL